MRAALDEMGSMAGDVRPPWNARAHRQQAVLVGEPAQQHGAEDGHHDILRPLIHPTCAPRDPHPASGSRAQLEKGKVSGTPKKSWFPGTYWQRL